MTLLAFLVTIPLLGQSTRRDMIVSADWLAARLDGQVIVIEIGEKADYDLGHIPSARLLERKDLLATVANVPDEIPPVHDLEGLLTNLGVGSDKRIVLYSRHPLLATRAWFTFDFLGHGSRTSVLDGGFAHWVFDGRPATIETPAHAADAFTAKPNLAALMRLRSMKTLVLTRASLGPALIMIDARSECDYDGAYSGLGVARAGHIPGAISIPWQRNLASEGQDALFRSEADLRALYKRARIGRDTTVIAYCRSGVEASMTYFVLRYLGFDPSLYDGSFIEWSNDDDTPVV